MPSFVVRWTRWSARVSDRSLPDVEACAESVRAIRAVRNQTDAHRQRGVLWTIAGHLARIADGLEPKVEVKATGSVEQCDLMTKIQDLEERREAAVKEFWRSAGRPR